MPERRRMAVSADCGRPGHRTWEPQNSKPQPQERGEIQRRCKAATARILNEAPFAHCSFEVEGVAPRESFHDFLSHGRMLLLKLLRGQLFHLLKIGGNEPGIRGIE